MSRPAFTFAVVLPLALVACSSEPPPPPPEDCSTGKVWTGGDEESPLMHPGTDCIACHEDEGEGPLYAVAGTVMGDLADPDDCYGVEGVTVRITDADAVVHELTTNAAGNFFSTAAVPGPFTVELELDGATSVMVTPQTDGACGACHTQEGLDLAPGRVLVP